MSNAVSIGVYKFDESTFSKVEKCCKQFFFAKNVRYDIQSINNKLLEDREYDILFVNVKELLHTLKSKIETISNKVKSCIIALADDMDSLLFAFKINSFRAMTNETREMEICDILDGVVDKLFHTEKISVDDGNEIHIVDVEDILYVEALGDSSVIITDSEQYVSNKPLKFWEDKLSLDNFFRCHKSYLVALDNVKYIKDNYIYFKSDTYNEYSVPISVRKRSFMKKSMHM